MKTFDFSLYIVLYNFVIGVLVMIASEKLGFFAGRLTSAPRGRVAHLAKIGAFTFGACVAIISGGVYLASYVLKLV